MDLPVVLAVLVSWFVVTLGITSIKRVPLIGDDNALLIHRDTPGCQFGSRDFFDLGEVWNPELEPTGVMHCIVCKCLPVIKKGVLQQHGKVTCRNVKHQCPRTDCDHPILAPGACCKLCPEQGPLSLDWLWGRGPRVGAPEPHPTPQEDRSDPGEDTPQTEYVAVLSSTTTRGVARGRFTLHSGTMYFTLQYSRTAQPVNLLFQDNNGTTLYDHPIHNTNPSINQACGTWQHIPKTHARALQQNKLSVTMVTKKSREKLTGNIVFLNAIEKETFSVLLGPDSVDGSGAIALLSLTSNHKSVNFLIRLTGFGPERGSPRNFTVQFKRGSKELKKFNTELSKEEPELSGVWMNIGKSVSKALARGRVSMVITTSHGITLKGPVTPKTSCDSHQAVLSGWAVRVPVSEGSGGSAVFNLLPSGVLQYQVHLVGMQARVTSLRLQTTPNKKGRVRKMCSLTKSLRKESLSKHVYDGWANGTCEKLTARQIHSFLHGGMILRANTRGRGRGALEGQISQILYNGHLHNRMENIIVLSGSGLKPLVETSVAANAWMTLDDACVLHYEVVTSGLDHNEDGSIRADLVVSLGEDGEQRWSLREFKGNVLRSRMAYLNPTLLAHISQGTAHIRISSKLKPDGLLAGKVHMPNTCQSRDLQPPSGRDILVEEQEQSRENDIIDRSTCYEDGKVREDGESWIPRDMGECHMCNCKNGKAECHKTLCPQPACDKPIMIKGDCCPQCVDNLKMETCYFDGDKRKHHFGTQWHPYIPPFGFSVCVVCSCSNGPSEFNCTRLECPRLNCLDYEAVRISPNDCCKVCPNRSPSTAVDDIMQGDGNMKGSCSWRGMKYANGAQWKPRIQPFGQMDCITCSCTDGVLRCRRKKCPKLNCRKKVKQGTSCCPVCAAESKKGRRGRRRQRKTNN